jgi:hypothetical protein
MKTNGKVVLANLKGPKKHVLCCALGSGVSLALIVGDFSLMGKGIATDSANVRGIGDLDAECDGSKEQGSRGGRLSMRINGSMQLIM